MQDFHGNIINGGMLFPAAFTTNPKVIKVPTSALTWRILLVATVAFSFS